MDHQIGLAFKGLGIGIPDLDNIMARLGTNREAIDNILTVLGDVFNHRRNSVAHKGGAGLTLENAERVGPAINIVVIFPERGDIVAHQEEHSVAQGVCFKMKDHCVKVAPRLHFTEAGEGGEGPVTTGGGVEEEGPGTRWDFCIKCIS